MKISFIIPAHNAADYIVRSVDSILNLFRTVVPFEIIIVENGSADDTPRLAAELADQHPEVLLCHSETGLPQARNEGMRHAGGEWICFVDADDQCEPEMVKAVSLLEKYGPDILAAGFRKGKRTVTSRYKAPNRLISGEELEPAKIWMISAPTRRMGAWAKFYSRDFLMSNHLFFDESLRRSEDSEFLIRALNRCDKMVISDLIIYSYSQDTVSMMRSVTQGAAAWYLEAIRKAERAASGGSPGVRAAFPDYVYSMTLIAAVHDFYDSAVKVPWAVRNRRQVLFLQEDPVKRAVAGMKIKNLLRPRNWPVFLFRHRLISLGGAVCYLRSVYNRRLWRA
ncbi:MAG: glycosyltransferase family 2 protein [Clostridia bacterium]|nr:glycosyltransferase family 2 protein [Clostridia bacterium]